MTENAPDIRTIDGIAVMETPCISGTLDSDACYRAVLSRDVRFDGRFYTAVRTTGIYCRPVCPAPTPKRKNCTWYPSAAAAQAAGFRPCLRCRPELAPAGTWSVEERLVQRAMALIVDGIADEDEFSVVRLAEMVDVNERTLRRLFEHHVGASPKQVLVAHRTLFAKALVVDSTLTMAQIAFASGHGSVRRFNAAFRAMFGRSPSEIRRTLGRSVNRSEHKTSPGTVLRVPYRRPFRWGDMLGFFAPRAIPGVEEVRDGVWRRAVRVGDTSGTVEVWDDEATSTLVAHVSVADVRVLAAVRNRLARVFDVEADPGQIDPVLAADPSLFPDVAARPGVRIPGSWDPFETVVRAVVGQQISVAGARTIVGRIASTWGTPLPGGEEERVRTIFPDPAALEDAELESVGVIRARSRTIRTVARMLSDDPDLLSPRRPTAEIVERLLEIRGIGPWTAQYIALRCLQDPDAFPAGDLGLKRALDVEDVAAAAERWRPWRGYGAVRLWTRGAPN
ncbi:MAG: helix-turn-helix domain-containing protein [Spirochaetales bacterium]|nr:helix-turn-helix domain-containing protein [Spirochaetales bacterium]